MYQCTYLYKVLKVSIINFLSKYSSIPFELFSSVTCIYKCTIFNQIVQYYRNNLKLIKKD